MENETSPLGSMISAGLGMASGNPLAIGVGAIGLGLSIFGTTQSTEAAKQKAELSKQVAGFEQQQDAVRRAAMEKMAQRQQIEVLRNAQRARSLALNNATSQGAQFGSGLPGGYGQIQGAANWNIAGINQSLGFGRQMFDLNAQINKAKMSMADNESSAATAAGYSSIGKSLMGAFTPVKNLSSNFAPSSPSGGSYQGIGNSGLPGIY